jgi:hypothetical protein
MKYEKKKMHPRKVLYRVARTFLSYHLQDVLLPE